MKIKCFRFHGNERGAIKGLKIVTKHGTNGRV